MKLVFFAGVCSGAFYGYKTYVLKQPVRIGGRNLGNLGGGGMPSFGGGLYDAKRF